MAINLSARSQPHRDGTAPHGETQPQADGQLPPLPGRVVEKLRLMRYSDNTIRTYRAMFADFINHFSHDDFRALGEPDVLKLLRYLVDERQVSRS